VRGGVTEIKKNVPVISVEKECRSDRAEEYEQRQDKVFTGSGRSS
jgi:hypothetical protein